VNDIECGAAGNLRVVDNRCNSTAPTNSISITTVAVNKPVYIYDNDCAKLINTDAADVTAGRVIVGPNVISGVQTFGDIRSDSGVLNGTSIGSTNADRGTFDFLSIDASTELTIDSGGAVVIERSAHSIDTFADAATDNLDTITNPDSKFTFLVLSANNGARTVNVRAGVGNIALASGATFSMDNTSDRLFLVFDAPTWFEVSRSDNGA